VAAGKFVMLGNLKFSAYVLDGLHILECSPQCLSDIILPSLRRLTVNIRPDEPRDTHFLLAFLNNPSTSLTHLCIHGKYVLRQDFLRAIKTQDKLLSLRISLCTSSWGEVVIIPPIAGNASEPKRSEEPGFLPALENLGITWFSELNNWSLPLKMSKFWDMIDSRVGPAKDTPGLRSLQFYGVRPHGLDPLRIQSLRDRGLTITL
jgi:hypothetical protein